jgi:hypothetical protein
MNYRYIAKINTKKKPGRLIKKCIWDFDNSGYSILEFC